MNKRVSISIHRGQVKADYSGFEGRECETLAERIDPGQMDVEEKHYKPEYDLMPHEDQVNTDSYEA